MRQNYGSRTVALDTLLSTQNQLLRAVSHRLSTTASFFISRRLIAPEGPVIVRERKFASSVVILTWKSDYPEKSS
jgi:hypothetical protein